MRDQIKDEAYFEEFFAYEARRIKWANKILDTPQNYVEQAIHNLNVYLFPDCESKMIKNLGWTDLGENLPEEYKGHPYFNF